MWRPLGEKSFYLFTFVLDPRHWNENADDTEPLSGGENISCILALGNNHLCVSHWDFFCRFFEPIICHNEAASAAAFFFVSGAWLVFSGDGLTCSHSFFLFTCWLEESDCVAAGCIKGGETCALSDLKSSARGHLVQACHILPDTFFLSLSLAADHFLLELNVLKVDNKAKRQAWLPRCLSAFARKHTASRWGWLQGGERRCAWPRVWPSWRVMAFRCVLGEGFLAQTFLLRRRYITDVEIFS